MRKSTPLYLSLYSIYRTTQWSIWKGHENFLRVK